MSERERVVKRKQRPTSDAEQETLLQPVESESLQRPTGGDRLDPSTRSYFESQFQYDFSDIRVHTDYRADESARELDALAYTSGKDIVFQSGQYAPGSREGQALLAHELTHVVQQGDGREGTPGRVSEPSETAELEADRVAQTVGRAGPGSKENHAGATGAAHQPGVQVQSHASAPAVFRKKAPTATESVGAKGTVTFVPGITGEENQTFAPGEKGYSQQLLPQLHTATLANLKNYEEAHLQPLEPNFTKLDKTLDQRVKEKVKAERAASGKDDSIFASTLPSTQKLLDERVKSADDDVKKMTSDRNSIEGKFASYNSWAPKANQLFVSLARLEGLQKTLGVQDPKDMATAVVESLKQAQTVAERANIKSGGHLDVPNLNGQVSAAWTETTLLGNEMRTAWLDFQQTVLGDRNKALEASGESDSKRLAEINKTIDTWAKIGKTVDLSLSVMSGAKGMLAGGTVSEADALAGNFMTGDSQIDKAKGYAKDVAGAAGIPTSIEGIVKNVVQFYYADEIKKIEIHLAELNTSIAANKEVASQMDIQAKIGRFTNALARYKEASKKLETLSFDRQMAYLKMGKQLDDFASKDPKSVKAGVAPDAGQERFATVMLLTSAIREVLAMGEGSVLGFDQPVQILHWIFSLNVYAQDDENLYKLHNRVQTYHDNVDMLREVLGPVDEQAAVMMRTLVGAPTPGPGQVDHGAY